MGLCRQIHWLWLFLMPVRNRLACIWYCNLMCCPLVLSPWPVCCIPCYPLLLHILFLPGVLIGLVIPSIGEEPGWRGFAFPRLQKQYGPIVATLILGTLHGIWHLPALFTPLFDPFTLEGFAEFVLTTILVHDRENLCQIVAKIGGREQSLPGFKPVDVAA